MKLTEDNEEDNEKDWDGESLLWRALICAFILYSFIRAVAEIFIW